MAKMILNANLSEKPDKETFYLYTKLRKSNLYQTMKVRQKLNQPNLTTICMT